MVLCLLGETSEDETGIGDFKPTFFKLLLDTYNLSFINDSFLVTFASAYDVTLPDCRPLVITRLELFFLGNYFFIFFLLII